MGIISWIIFGAIIGWLASVLMNTGSSLMWDILMGIIGAVVGGFLMSALGQPGVTGFNLYSVLVSVIGAVVVISIARMLRHNA